MTKQTRPKRIKRVFSSSAEVFHLWANQSQSNARQGGTRTRSFFDGESCYSYGHHYEVGRLVTINGHKFALINRSGYSTTTEKHIREASSAASHLSQIDVTGLFDWKQGLLNMQGKLIDRLFNDLNRRSFWTDSVFDQYDRKLYNEFNKVCELVGMKHLQLFPDADTLSVIKAHVKKCIARKEELKALRHTPEYIAKQEKAKAQKEAREQVKKQAEIDAWVSGTGPVTNAVRDASPQLIRIKGTEVQTSRQATVRFSEAYKALKAALRGALTEGDAIGNYQFTRFENDCVVIGCHRINLSHARKVLGL